jgi:hypothetical protein
MGAPILLLLAIRQEAYAADDALREWLTRLERDVPLARLLLDSLSGAAVEYLVSDLAGEGVDEAATSAFAAWLWADDFDLRLYRKRIETVDSQMEKMGIQSLHARTNLGFDLKAWASLLALAFTNIID